MKLFSLSVKNFRCFAELEKPVEFHEKMTVFAAVNGRGKSSILDAITVGLSPYASHFEHGDSKGFKRPDATLHRITSDNSDQVHVLRVPRLGFQSDWKCNWSARASRSASLGR